jgi:hypothetical protein
LEEHERAPGKDLNRRWADTVGAKIGAADLETANEILGRVLELVSPG